MILTGKYRRKARELAFKTLYTSDIADKDLDTAFNEYLERYKDSFSDKTLEYAKFLIDGLKEKKEEIDEKIKSHLTDWKFERLGYPERALLRLGTFEILYSPIKDKKRVFVDILDFSNCYLSSKKGTKFINGILNVIYRESRNYPSAPSSTSNS